MTDYSKLVEALRYCVSGDCENCSYFDKCKENGTAMDQLHNDAAAAIEELQAEVKRLQDKLCDWCAVCPKERRKPENCELLSETPVMYGPSCEKKE